MSYHTAPTLRLPPYGRILEAYCAEKIHLAQPIYIYLGNEGKNLCAEGHRWQNMWTYLPDGQPYESFHWPIKGQNVVIHDLVIRRADFATHFAMFLQDKFQPKTIAIYSEYFPLIIVPPYGDTYHGR